MKQKFFGKVWKVFPDSEIFWKEEDIWNRGECIIGLGGWTPLHSLHTYIHTYIYLYIKAIYLRTYIWLLQCAAGWASLGQVGQVLRPAAVLLGGCPGFLPSPITAYMREVLHWLPISQRILFRILFTRCPVFNRTVRYFCSLAGIEMIVMPDNACVNSWIVCAVILERAIWQPWFRIAALGFRCVFNAPPLTFVISAAQCRF